MKNKMNKEFIPYEESLELKALDFDEPCFGYYGVENKLHIEVSSNLDSNLTRRNFITSPTYSQAFRWFRKKYFKMSYVYYDVEYRFCFCIGYNDKTKGFNTYEEAELACLKELIELVKNK